MLEAAAVGIPSQGNISHESDLETSNYALQINPGPDPATPGDTRLGDLPISSGDYRQQQMQSIQTVTPFDALGEMPNSGLHGVVVPLSQPSNTLSEPDFWELGYVVRQPPSTSDANLGVID